MLLAEKGAIRRITGFALVSLLPLSCSCFLMYRSCGAFIRSNSRVMSTTSSIEGIAKRLVQTNKEYVNPNHVCIAVAGGGGHAIATLAATPGASSLFLEGTVAYDRNSFQSYVGELVDDSSFKFSSLEAAEMLSRAAVRRALQYRANLDEYPRCIGIGVASALVSTRKHSKKSSFGYIVATRADGSQWTCNITLAPESRTRLEEDQFMGELALRAVEQLQTRGTQKLVLEDEEDQIEESFHQVDSEDPIAEGAKRILRGDVEAILFLPLQDKFVAMTDPVLPLESLVFPGSFNPPHQGHTTLAQVASSAWDGASSAVFLELSLSNPDKPSMSPESVSERAHAFFGLQDHLPKEWGILLTRAPLFARKVEVLKPFMAPGRFGSECIVKSQCPPFLTPFIPDSVQRGGRPQMGFVIGTDTMVRILNPMYYGDSEEDMFEAVRAMGHSGVHFVVGGRLEQRGGDEDGRFVTGEDEVRALPKDVQSLFTLVKEDDFRVDISSTEIRKRKEEQKKEL